MDHQQAVINAHRKTRLESSTGSAGRLADVERAALAWQKKVTDEKTRLATSGDFSPQYIGKQIARLGFSWIEEKEELEKIVLTVEHSLKRVPDALPKRTENHRELSAHFKTLKGDARHEAITAALMGRDDTLAEALATEPPFTSTLMENDRQTLIKILQPQAHADEQARAAELQSRITATRATLSEVTRIISGASQ